jgi:peptidoglycan/xylan/chitin deacetylase (PgdA/CDA1 family)
MITLNASRENKEVALLFDDGPNPYVTPKLLKVLESKNVSANFFLIGRRAEQSPEIVEKIVEGGHEIGNHTYTHKRLTLLLEEQGKNAVIDEVVKAKRAIEKITDLSNNHVKFLRPPYLDWSEELAKVIEPIYGDNIIMSGLSIGDWNWGRHDSWDRNDASAIHDQAKRITETWKQTLNSGTLLGFHDGSEHNLPGNKQYDTWIYRALPTLEAITYIIDFLRAQGYKIKRLSDMSLIKEEYIKK